MKKKILFLLILCECFVFSSRAQMPLVNIPDVFKDSTTTAPGIITAFEHDSATNKLYIAGEFQRVGTVVRKGFAVIDMNTGNVLNDLSFIQLESITNLVRIQATLKLFNGNIYIGGLFITSLPLNTYLLSVPLNGNVNSVNYIYGAPVSDFEIYNSKIYTCGAYYFGQPADYEVNEMDLLGNISWTQSISSAGTDHLSCLSIKNNFLHVGGVFNSFGGVSLKNVARVNLATHTITTWQPNPLPGPAGNLSCFDTHDLAQFGSDLYLSVAATICSSPSKSLIAYDITTGNTDATAQSITYFSAGAIIAESDTSYWYGNTAALKVYGIKNYMGSWSPASNAPVQTYFRKAGYLFVGGSFTTLQNVAHTALGVYCVKPTTPVRASSYTSACQGQSGLFYSVKPVRDATSYQWSYTGTGLTITGSSSLVSMSLSNTATSGTIKVVATSYCGTPSDTLYIPFTVNIKPAVSAGPDVRFTCSHNLDTLKGSSTTAGVTYSWAGPSYSSTSPTNQVLNTISGGKYILTVTTPVGCKNKDTAMVIFDTAAPAINHNLSPGILTCTTGSIALSAAPLYPGASLHWSGNSFSQPDPATVTTPGNYTLTIASSINDCVSKDTFWVKSNTVLPNISAPATLDTITCLHDSVLLSANTTTSRAILYWKTLTDSLLNNSYTHSSGTYVAHAKDTVNGCGAQLIRPVAQFTTPPVVIVPTGNFNVNCSFSSVTLNGSTPNAGATLLWTGPNSFSSADPITVSQAGTYTLTATNPQNGCAAEDSVNITLQHILIVHACTDTLICNGSSATLDASPVGGTPGFTYSWSGTTATNNSVIVSPNDTTDYIVTITDNAGCVGSDTVRVMVPLSIGDSVNTFQPCDPNNPNGQIQAYGTGGIPPYSFAMNSGGFQSSGIFTGLNFGVYQVTLKDTLGCSVTFSAVIDSSSIRPSPDFLLSTTEIKGDTFVIVDISNPRPDSVHWLLPANCSIINTDPFAPQVIHSDTGAFQVTMMAWFGDCLMQLTKNLTIIWPDTSIANSHNNNGISDLTLYPNPNSGQFTVDIALYKKQAVAIFIFDGVGNELLRLPYPSADHVNANIQMNNPSPGSYVLKVIAEYDSRTKIFLISQH